MQKFIMENTVLSIILNIRHSYKEIHLEKDINNQGCEPGACYKAFKQKIMVWSKVPLKAIS